jgi:hypothetical protein
MPRKQKTVEEREAEYNGRTNLKARYLPFYPANEVKGTLSANKQKMYERAKAKLKKGEGVLTVGQSNVLAYASNQKASK